MTNQLLDLIVKRTFKRKELVFTGRFYQTAGLFGINKDQSKIYLKSLIKKGVIKQKRKGFLELGW